ncbi:stress response protein [Egibacter rhizosphaerae]|uniref:Stress response protein n=1 Tax=Egibacter rhizosphaerae TaxID=1670831 RepID=A0A411YBL3_9ACTN|nr:stress response protein [Egibacter rhizosphaerae]QBI18590.1 stress response protein [Egibacter rhizosphaerae]
MAEGNGEVVWQAARLIPTAGIGGAREQEQRATSTLLAVMSGVPGFGRELLAGLGAPRGKVEAYTEVPFTDEQGKTVRPDGVIVATRGKRRWSVLVEVKTRNNTASAEQVTSYLDVARREGFDGVLVIDNHILGGPDDVPVEVPKKKLRSVSLWQLSWWRILTEAIIQHDHRGIEDTEQQWILRELIAYLLHENSGAGEFDDMGPSWTKVRDGARRDALNAKQPEVADIARRWEQFVHYVALGMTQDLGRDVVPERSKKPLDERLADTRSELAEHGTLSMSLKVPDAVGLVALTADMRARMVTSSVGIKAPREGKPTTQVNWILRQLRDAPDDLRIETKFVRTSKSTTVLLGDVRDKPKHVLLADDPKREPREFALSLARPMGTKKTTGPGAFITDTRQQAIDFYRDLVQHLSDWQPSAPRMRSTRSSATDEHDADSDSDSDTSGEWHAPPPDQPPDHDTASSSEPAGTDQ